MEIIENRFTDLKQKWHFVQDKHESYISALFSVGVEVNESEDSWINEIETVFAEVERKKFAYVRSLVSVKEDQVKEENLLRKENAIKMKQLEINNNIDKAIRIRAFEEKTFYEEAENLNEMLEVERSQSDPAVSVIQVSLEDFKRQFEKCKQAQRDVMIFLDQLRAKEEIDWVQKIHNRKVEKPNLVNSGKGAGLRLERMKMPVFDGDIRDYPRFKSDFMKQVVPEMKSNDSTAYVPRSCLTKIPLDIVKNVDNDLKEMWRRLDDRYGRPSKLADVVMYDIKRIRPVRDGDDKRFIELVDII